eukprot:6905592-Karenia_brevis.AAC.1
MPLQAIMVLRELGCPKQVADILEVFYNQYERWVEYKGACAAKPIKARLSILQGCPASCLLMTALSAVWHRGTAMIEGVKAGYV